MIWLRSAVSRPPQHSLLGPGAGRVWKLQTPGSLRRVIYVYGTADEPIGRLSEAEDAFLRSKGSTVITVEGGHHGSTVAAAISRCHCEV